MATAGARPLATGRAAPDAMAAAGSPSVFLLAVNGQIESGQVSRPPRAVWGGSRRPPEEREAPSPRDTARLGPRQRSPVSARVPVRRAGPQAPKPCPASAPAAGWLLVVVVQAALSPVTWAGPQCR